MDQNLLLKTQDHQDRQEDPMVPENDMAAPWQPKTYGFIGLGLIGGSLAKALRSLEPEATIYACARSVHTGVEAMTLGLIDAILKGPSDPLLSQCDMIFLCAPVETNIHTLDTLKTVLSPSCLLTDVGSVKTGIHQKVRELGLTGQFIGGHPMTGSEKTGLDNANDHLFENAYFILTPEPDVPKAMLDAYYALVRKLNALPLILRCETHDFITAAVSHLPHLIASALVNTVHNLDDPDEHMKLIAAGGFKDITRIASSSPEMWEQICMDNGENISRVMDEFIRLLQDARTHITGRETGYIYEMFEQSRDYRNSFGDHAKGALHPAYRIYCDIIDEAGAIATIATILACGGVNIKNIGIVHNREYEEGVLRIEFYSMEMTKKAAGILRHHGYIVYEM